MGEETKKIEASIKWNKWKIGIGVIGTGSIWALIWKIGWAVTYFANLSSDVNALKGASVTAIQKYEMVDARDLAQDKRITTNEANIKSNSDLIWFLMEKKQTKK